MTRIDWVILRRLAARIGITVAVFFGLLCLVESVDSWRFRTLSDIGGPLLAITSIVTAAARNLIGVAPVVLLIGTIFGVLDLQSRRELTLIKSAGHSIWRILRAPVLAAAALGAFIGFVADPGFLNINRSLPVIWMPERGDLWLEQTAPEGDYMLQAKRTLSHGTSLEDVALFFTVPGRRTRVEAPKAQLTEGAWELTDAVIYNVDEVAETAATYRVATATTAGDMRIMLTAVKELTFAELVNIVSQTVSDPKLRAAAFTGIFKPFALPAMMVGSVLIGFAFTSGYQRTNKYGGAVLYGVLLGFVLYVITELAYRSGYAGVLDPVFAASGPAFAAIVVGLTVLLYKEDGRT